MNGRPRCDLHMFRFFRALVAKLSTVHVAPGGWVGGGVGDPPLFLELQGRSHARLMHCMLVSCQSAPPNGSA